MTIRDQLGIDDDLYEELLRLSGDRCWICARPEGVPGRRLAVDHDHRTGAVRGLLCTSCNRRLGKTVDPEWLRRAASYLETAARAHGDDCDTCGQPAPSRLIESRREPGGGQWSIFEHTCCGRTWRCGYQTHGYPNAWTLHGVPVPPERPPLDSADVGFPAEEPER